jgi:hypothetical protein
MVGVDPVAALPPAEPRSEASEGLVVLERTYGADDALAVVGRFYDGLARDDAAALARVFSSDATWGGPSALEPALGHWTRRRGRVDLRASGGGAHWSPDSLSLFRGDAPEARGALGGSARTTAKGDPDAAQRVLRSSDLVVRVTRDVPAGERSSPLGRQTWFWLQPREGELKIVHGQDDFEPSP